jgi:hypothetical protein
VKLRFLLVLGACVMALSGTAAAKYASYKLTVDGPGMPSPGTIRDRGVIDRLSNETLEGTELARVDPPPSSGPAYLLEYAFAVGDEKGGRLETIRQTLYPFAAGGPVVFTPRRQKIDMSFGPVRFTSGWFEVRGSVLRELRGIGLPDSPPEDGPGAVAAPRLDPPPTKWPWYVGLAALTAGAGVLALRRTT